MTLLETVCQELASIAPLRLAESWDNVGLLVGDRQRKISRVMTCLTISPDVVAEAIDEQADLVVAHHPLPFKALSRITNDSIPGKMLWQLIGAKIAIYSAHTAFDSAQHGINQLWANKLSLQQCDALIANANDDSAPGAGRVGKLPEPCSLESLILTLATSVGSNSPRRVGDADKLVRRVGFACGSGGSFLSAAKRHGCDALITGEATFHTCLEAETLGIGLGLLGHYWSERFAMEHLAEELSKLPLGLTVWPSRHESDPLHRVDVG